MIQSNASIVSLLSVFTIVWGASSLLWAGKAPVKPQAPLKPSQEREDYQECIKEVIKKYKATDAPQRKLRVQNGVNGCRERYPAVSIMIDCKREMMVAYKDNHSDLKLALKQCREEYLKYTFQPKLPVPFVLKEEQIFFAGAGLNLPLSLKTKASEEPSPGAYLNENFGNFSCSPLKAAMQNEQAAEHLLFGNELFLYTPLRHANKEAFVKSLGLKLGKEDAVVQHPELGEIHFNAARAELMNYFPSSYCYFNRKLGTLYEGIKIYYLLDRKSAQVSPYFGVAFYSETAQLESATIAKQIQQALGQSYGITQPKEGVFLVAQNGQQVFDSEGDPKNICQSGQAPPYMALVHSREGSSLAAYSLLANTANLCRYGDRVTSRLLKKGAVKSPAP